MTTANTEIQQTVLGALMAMPELAEEVWTGITIEHFDPGARQTLAGALYALHTDGVTANPQTALAFLQAQGLLERNVTSTWLFETYQRGGTQTPASLRSLLGHLDLEFRREQVRIRGVRLQQAAELPGGDFELVSADVLHDLEMVTRDTSRGRIEMTQTLDDLMSATYPDQEFTIPRLIARGERVVITGGEGYGKSELIYQLAIGPSLGLHPLTRERMPQAKVLVVDAENRQRQVAERLRRKVGMQFRQWAGNDTEAWWRYIDAGGWDLLSPRDAGFFLGLVRELRPDIVVLGPVYQLIDADTNEAETVRRFARVVDEAIRISGCSVIMEAHANNEGGDGKRHMRPSGSALWRRWPDFGLGLVLDKDDRTKLNVTRWRGDRVRGREWPDSFRQGRAHEPSWVPKY